MPPAIEAQMMSHVPLFCTEVVNFGLLACLMRLKYSLQNDEENVGNGSHDNGSAVSECVRSSVSEYDDGWTMEDRVSGVFPSLTSEIVSRLKQECARLMKQP